MLEVELSDQTPQQEEATPIWDLDKSLKIIVPEKYLCKTYSTALMYQEHKIMIKI